METLTLKGHTGLVVSVAFSPDGRRIASGGQHGEVKVWDAATGQEILTLSGHASPVTSVAFSPDGRRIASASFDGTIRIWDGPSNDERAQCIFLTKKVDEKASAPGPHASPSSSPAAPAFPPAPHPSPLPQSASPKVDPQLSGPLRATVGQGFSIKEVGAAPLPTGTPPSTTPLQERFPSARRLAVGGAKPSWSPDGRQIVFGQMPFGSGVRIVNVETLAVSDLSAPGKDPAWSPRDEKLVALVRGDEAHEEEVWIADTSGKKPSKIADGGWPVWASDGKSLYFHSRRTMKIMKIGIDPPGEPAPVCDMPYAYYPPVTGDGKRTAYLDRDELVVLDIETQEALAKRRITGWYGFVAGWSPDGKLPGYGSYGGDNAVGLWIMNVETGKVIQVAEGPFTAPAWSPDGSKLALDRRAGAASEVWIIETKDLERLWNPR